MYNDFRVPVLTDGAKVALRRRGAFAHVFLDSAKIVLF